MQALLITDNLQDEAILSTAIRLAGMHIATVGSLQSGLKTMSDSPADVFVVAVRNITPVAVVREIRAIAVAPLILIVEGIDEDTHVGLVEAGADWVVERPYNTRLLGAYIRALSRRTGNVSRISLPNLDYAAVHLNPGNRSVSVGDAHPMRLSQLEFRLLHTLMIHQGQVLPTETIVEHVWGYSGDGDRSLVRGLINRLRMKIEPNANAPQYIRTVARVGYIFGSDE